jgi:hypothetical protein
MTIVLLLVGGIVTCFLPGDACMETLHQLRTEERLDIVATDVLEDNVIAFTLDDGPRRAAKTAFLVCERDLDTAADDGADFVDGADPLAPVGEPLVPVDDALAPGDPAAGASAQGTTTVE